MSGLELTEIVDGADIRFHAQALGDFFLGGDPLAVVGVSTLPPWGFICDPETRRAYLGKEAFQSFIKYRQPEEDK